MGTEPHGESSGALNNTVRVSSSWKSVFGPGLQERPGRVECAPVDFFAGPV